MFNVLVLPSSVVVCMLSACAQSPTFECSRACHLPQLCLLLGSHPPSWEVIHTLAHLDGRRFIAALCVLEPHDVSERRKHIVMNMLFGYGLLPCTVDVEARLVRTLLPSRPDTAFLVVGRSHPCC